MQLLFFVLVIVLLLILIPFTTVGYFYIVKLMEEVPPGYEYPQVSDFKISIYAAGVIAIG